MPSGDSILKHRWEVCSMKSPWESLTSSFPRPALESLPASQEMGYIFPSGFVPPAHGCVL